MKGMQLCCSSCNLGSKVKRRRMKELGFLEGAHLEHKYSKQLAWWQRKLVFYEEKKMPPGRTTKTWMFLLLLLNDAGKRGEGECFGLFSAALGVRNMARFLVAPLPKRLCGGNTASSCPRPPLFLSLFLTCLLSPLFPPCVSHSLVPTLSSPSLFVSALFALSVALVQASHRGTRLNFPSTSPPLRLPLSFLHISPPALFPSTCVLLFFSFFFFCILPPNHTSPPTPLPNFYSPYFPLICIPLSLDSCLKK